MADKTINTPAPQKHITREQMLTLLDDGKIIGIGLYGNGRVETVKVRDKTNPNGPRRDAYVERQNILVGKGILIVSRWLRDDEHPADFVEPCKMGGRVCVVVDGMELQNGVPVARGTVLVMA